MSYKSRSSLSMTGVLGSLSRSYQLIDMTEEPYSLEGGRPIPSLLTKAIKDVENYALHGPPISFTALPAFVDAAKNLNTVGLDDRKLLLEKLLTLMSRLPGDSIFSKKLQQFVVDILYKDLPHPPSGYLALPPAASTTTARAPGTKIKYAFRSTDGSDYNPLSPNLGQAGSPYARSVPSTNTTPVSSLPDPGLVFDTLLRREKFEPHPGGVSSLFFAFANLVIHSCFNTDHRDYTINNTSSYLDLSILYGSTDETINSIRKIDGTGRIHDDVFADSRLLLMPPSACALLILFSRNHNYIAEKILNINERGNFISPNDINPTDVKKLTAQDDEIFHKARLVNCGFFVRVILGDYVGAILGLVRDGSSWRLDPLQTMRDIDHEFSPQGEGNVVSVEFNLLYRWHATLSEQDTEWTEKEFLDSKMFKDKDFNTITPQEFVQLVAKHLTPPKDIKQWTFGGLKRGTNGRFDDGDLANILQNGTEWSAGAFKARGTPDVLRVIEILSIEQSRSWGTCSLNEFRSFLGLKPYANFKEWNPDPSIYTAAEALYSDIDNLELHVGLQAEETKKPGPGAGLCPGYTISRSILADAIALTRGDRFLTVDFTPFNLTSWGYQDCQYNKDDGSYGGMLTKLLFRTLPNHYPAGSAYAHFPFLVPDCIKKSLAKLPNNPVEKYIWTRPPAPLTACTVSSYEDVKQVLDGKEFESVYGRRISNITDGIVLSKNDISRVLFLEKEIRSFTHSFQNTVNLLIREKSVNHVGSTLKYVDIVKDVINLLPVHWIADDIVGLEMKTKSNPRGIYREQELYQAFADVCNYVFINSDPSLDWTLRERARKITEEVTGCIEGHIERLNGSILSVSGFSDSLIGFWAGQNNSDNFLKQLLAIRRTRSAKQIAASVFSEVVPTAAAYSKAVAHIVDFYLDSSRADARHDIAELSNICTPESEAKIIRYVHEALRLQPPVSAVVRTTATDKSLRGGMNLRAGEQIIAHLTVANLDRNVFGPNSLETRYDRRPTDKPAILGVGQHGLLTSAFFQSTITTVLGAIFNLKGLQRAPGQSGKFNSFIQKSYRDDGVSETLYINDEGQVTPWPASLVVQYEAKYN